jgi:hypothetical protein
MKRKGKGKLYNRAMQERSKAAARQEKQLDPFRWVPWVLVPLMLILYASHPTRKYYFDGVVFAANIEHGSFESLFNPHHLLYTWVFYLIHNATETALGKPIQALYLMQWFNIFLGAAGVLLIWRLLARLVADKGLALLVTLLGCLSFTYWHYATDADAYMLSLCFLLMAADRLEWIARHRAPRAGDFVYIGLIQAGSILFHQINIFWLTCVAGCLAFGVIGGSRRDRWRWWWIYFWAMATPVVAGYALVGTLVLGHTTPEGFAYWLTEYGHEGSYWVQRWQDLPLATLNGYLMVFFHRPSITPGILDYDIHLALEEGRLFKGLVKKVFGFYSLGFLFFCYLAALYNLKKYVLQYRDRALFALSWLAPYVLFQFFFMPLNYFYKLFIFVPLLAVFAWYESIEITPEKKWFKWPVFAAFVIYTAWAEPLLGGMLALFIIVFEVFRDRKALIYRWGLFILIAFLPLYNYIAGIAPEANLSNNPEVERALELQDRFREGDVLIFEGGYDYPDGWIIAALTPARVITLGELFSMSDGEREATLEAVADVGGRIWIHPNIAEGSDHLDRCAQELGVSREELLKPLKMYTCRPGFKEGGRQYMELAPAEESP